jgi:hypothetical protein
MIDGVSATNIDEVRRLKDESDICYLPLKFKRSVSSACFVDVVFIRHGPFI